MAKKFAPEVIVPTVGIAVLCFMIGSFVTEFESFPYPQLLEDGYEAIRAQRKALAASTAEATATNLWAQSRTKKRGVVSGGGDRVWGDYTFYTSGHTPGALLVGLDGEILHEWKLNFRDVWPDPKHVEPPPKARLTYWRRAHLFPNGDVVAIFVAANRTPWGYGMIKVDKNSELIWSYAGRTHHDFDIDDEGNIYVLTHEFRDTSAKPVPNNPQFPDMILEDFLVKLSPEGDELWRFSVLDAVAKSKFQSTLNMDPGPHIQYYEDEDWDLMHANTVEYVTAAFAEHHSFAELGQVMVSFRSLDAIGLLDVESQKMVWANRGFWTHQHDPDVLDNGNVMILDNRGNVGPGGGSRIIEFNPATYAIEWVYTGTQSKPFYSRIRGVQHPLPNGNVLVTESDAGRIFEVTRDNKIVWDYVSPARAQSETGEKVAIVSGAHRIAAGELAFEFGGPIARE